MRIFAWVVVAFLGMACGRADKTATAAPDATAPKPDAVPAQPVVQLMPKGFEGLKLGMTSDELLAWAKGKGLTCLSRDAGDCNVTPDEHGYWEAFFQGIGQGDWSEIDAAGYSHGVDRVAFMLKVVDAAPYATMVEQAKTKWGMPCESGPDDIMRVTSCHMAEEEGRTVHFWTLCEAGAYYSLAHDRDHFAVRLVIAKNDCAPPRPQPTPEL